MIASSLTLRVDRFSDRKGGHLNHSATQTILRDTMRGISMKQIDISTPTYPNTFALVDDADFKWLNRWKWSATKHRDGGFIARRAKRIGVNNMRTLLMHRLIMGEIKGMEVDHRNHNTLDNQKHNLRVCTRSQNQHNQKVRRGGSSKYKGVVFHKQIGKWESRIRLNGVRLYIGLFVNEIKAAKAYDAKAIELFGEFAYLNFAPVEVGK